MTYTKQSIEIEKYSGKHPLKAKFALLDTKTGKFSILKDMWKGYTSSNRYISLKDVSYSISKEGILNIIGTRLHFDYLFWNPISWKFYYLYVISDEFLEKGDAYEGDFFDTPLISFNRRRWFGLWHTKYKNVFNSSKFSNYIKLKKEESFEYSLHPFKLWEK